MGACTSKAKKYQDDHSSNGSNKKKKKSSTTFEQATANNHIDHFANVPFIDSEEKVTSTPPPLSPANDQDEQTTVKNNFETNVSYSNTETIEKLKKEVVTFLREKILPVADERQKLVDYVLKRIIGNPTEKKLIGEYLDECLTDIEEHEQLEQENKNNPNDKIKNRLMHMITIYVASQSSENSFLKALYDKMGSSLDLNSLNAETREHELVQVTVTKRVRQVFLDGSSSLETVDPSNPTTTVIHLSSNEQNIPNDLPEDIRRKAEQVLHSFNEVIHAKQS